MVEQERGERREESGTADDLQTPHTWRASNGLSLLRSPFDFLLSAVELFRISTMLLAALPRRFLAPLAHPLQSCCPTRGQWRPASADLHLHGHGRRERSLRQ